MIGTFSHLNGNNRLVCKVSFSTCTLSYSVQYSSIQACIVVYSIVVYKPGNTLVGQLWLIISGHVIQFHYLWPIMYLWNAKTGNLKRIIGLIYKFLQFQP